ncbi:MAG: chemotaxis protein CheX [Solidesulfovibrio sp.]
MFSHYFGNHLLSRRLLTPAQLKEILTSLDSVHIKLGMLAIESGLMTAHQVGEVHTLQISLDKRFGEIAVERGYLSPSSLEDLLGRQNKRHLALSQALLDKGWFDFEQLEAALADFKSATNLTDAELQALQHNDVDAVVAAFFRDAELTPVLETAPDALAVQTPMRLIQDYVALFVRNMVRFVDPAVAISKASCVSSLDFEWCVSQQMHGAISLCASLVGPGPILALVAGRFANMDLTEMDAVAKDALGELLNCHNGLFLSKLSNDGLDLELSPPAVHHRRTLFTPNTLCVIPISLPAGNFELVFTWGSPALA